MKSIINQQLELIENASKWVVETSSMQGAKGRSAYSKLVDFRRKLNKKKNSIEGNPAVAIYGESQMGKSYLVGGLLSENGLPFTVVDGKGNKYDFIEEINPIGNNSESTGVVTRFSTEYQIRNADFPIKTELLSPTDLVLILCDSYYNDVNASADIALKSEAINQELSDIQLKHGSNKTKQQIITEDEIKDINDYFIDNFSTKTINVIHSNFFETIPSLISKIEPNEWFHIFSLLWNNNEKITKIFQDIISQYIKLEFASCVFVPMDAVLRAKGTLLDVDRLKEIYVKYDGTEPDYQAELDILLLQNGQEKLVQRFPKSILSALVKELVFSLPKELEANKPFLTATDLLDFPGARRREAIREEYIEAKISDMLLRGKVAYLFNRYSYFERINILFFCHNSAMSSTNVMPELLRSWINEMVGSSPLERQIYIEKSIISPLFVISTMFNKDMEYSHGNDRANNQSYLDNRWERRFKKTLKKEIFGASATKAENERYNWLEQWTTTQNNFQNIYLLRDYKYSSDTGTGSQLYKGYNESKKELQEIIPPTYPNFRKDLRESFLNYEFVKKHFANPANSWDRASSINEDGTQLIIDNLTIAASNINVARNEKNVKELNSIAQGILSELQKYFHDSDSDAQLLKAKSTAGNIRQDLDLAFGQNPYFFGQMMKELMVREDSVLALFQNKTKDIERKELVNMDKYIGIRLNVNGLNRNDDFETNLERLRLHYDKSSKEECQKHLESEGMDLNELFYGNNQGVKNFSDILADALEEYWFEQFMLESKQNLAKIFSEAHLQDIQSMLKALYTKLGISKIIANRIRNHVDGYRSIEDTYAMIADISAETVNKFINTVGLEYFSEADINSLKEANEENSLGLTIEHNELTFEQNTLAEAAALITSMGNLSEMLNQNPLPLEAKRLPNYRNYIIWYNLLKVGFVFANDIPNYDVQANNKLGTIIEKCKTIKY